MRDLSPAGAVREFSQFFPGITAAAIEKAYKRYRNDLERDLDSTPDVPRALRARIREVLKGSDTHVHVKVERLLKEAVQGEMQARLRAEGAAEDLRRQLREVRRERDLIQIRSTGQKTRELSERGVIATSGD